MKHKKFIATILTLIYTACIVLGFSGCNMDEARFTVKILENTAETPCYEIPSVSSSAEERYRIYREFEDYILGDFKDINSNAFYYIEPYVKSEDGFIDMKYYWFFHVYDEADNNRKVLSEIFNFYDKKLGGYVKDYYGGELPPPGVVDYSVGLEFIFPTLKTPPQGSELVIEFGNLNVLPGGYEKFINLYIGESCIGTCYYHEAVNVPKSWFVNYFAHKLNVVNE